jgi:uncharacterized protein YraI
MAHAYDSGSVKAYPTVVTVSPGAALTQAHCLENRN